MSTLLVRNAAVLVTMDDRRQEISRGGLWARDGWIEAVGPSQDLPPTADEILDLDGHLVLPGLVNTHHHLYQTLTRAVPLAQDADLFGWLKALYPIWARLTPEDIRISTQLGLAELALSGCTTAADHLYLFPNGSRIDDEVEAAQAVGVRFHAARGSMSVGESQGGLPPDRVVEAEDAILADSDRVISAFHDPSPGAMTRVVLAPCSPFSVSPDLMRESAELARARRVHLHTHLAETLDEERYCAERFGKRPLEFVEDLEWSGADVWFAHAVHITPEEVARMAKVRSGVAHCPSSNMRLASGIAPLRRYMAAKVPVGLGVDGSASNDSSHMLAEARQALLLARLAHAAAPSVNGSAGLLTARQALELATRGGAAVLGRDDLGSLEPGKCADFLALDLDRLEYSGAGHDPVAAAVFCSPVRADHLYVHGRAVVSQGQLLGLDLGRLVEAHNRASRRLVDGR